MEADKRKAEFTIIGAGLIDVLACPVKQEELFRRGSSPAETLRLSFGGDALNEAAVLCRLGGKVRLLSKVGADIAGDMVLRYCADLGIDTSGIARIEGLDTSVNVALVDEKGERCFLTNPASSLRKLGEDDLLPNLRDVSGIVSLASIFVSERLRIPEMTDLFRKIRTHRDVTICADFTQTKHGETLDDLKPFLPCLDFVFPNEFEASNLTGIQDAMENAALFNGAGAGCAVIKQGARGCLIRTNEACWHVPAFPAAHCVDTTGAGDTFAAGFLFALSKKLPLPECGRFACAAASCAVEHLGAAFAVRDLSQVEERYRQMPEAESVPLS